MVPVAPALHKLDSFPNPAENFAARSKGATDFGDISYKHECILSVDNILKLSR